MATYDLALDELEERIPASFDLETELEIRELTEYINRFLADLPVEDRNYHKSEAIIE